jgi:hypothetical protein
MFFLLGLVASNENEERKKWLRLLETEEITRVFFFMY